MKKNRADMFPDGCMFTGSKRFDLHHFHYLCFFEEKPWLDIIPLTREWHDKLHWWRPVLPNGKVMRASISRYKVVDFALANNITLSQEVIDKLRIAETRLDSITKERDEELAEFNKREDIFCEKMSKELGFTKSRVKRFLFLGMPRYTALAREWTQNEKNYLKPSPSFPKKVVFK
jgi:hypothetical protein